MRTWSDYFPSKYLKAEDLNGSDLTVTVDRVVEETMPDLNNPNVSVVKPVLYFREGVKPMVPGKYIGNILSGMFGRSPQDCVGQRITLFAEQRSVFGKPKMCVSVRMQVAPPPGPSQYSSPAPPKRKAKR